jgi:hypothetical protein
MSPVAKVMRSLSLPQHFTTSPLRRSTAWEMQTYFTVINALTTPCLVISATDVAVTRKPLKEPEVALRPAVTTIRIAWLAVGEILEIL